MVARKSIMFFLVVSIYSNFSFASGSAKRIYIYESSSEKASIIDFDPRGHFTNNDNANSLFIEFASLAYDYESTAVKKKDCEYQFTIFVNFSPRKLVHNSNLLSFQEKCKNELSYRSLMSVGIVNYVERMEVTIKNYGNLDRLKLSHDFDDGVPLLTDLSDFNFCGGFIGDETVDLSRTQLTVKEINSSKIVISNTARNCVPPNRGSEG